MNKLLSLVILAGVLAVNPMQAMHSYQDGKHANHGVITFQYLDWLHTVGGQAGLALFAPDFISPHCTKVINGKKVANNLTEIIRQMDKAREDFGGWQIHNFSVLKEGGCDGHARSEGRFYFTTVKDNKTYIVSVRLTFDSGNITAIEDIHTQVEN